MSHYSLLITLYHTAIQRLLLLSLASAVLLLLSGCLYKNPPSGPACQVDSWLTGVWMAQDKSGKNFETVITPKTNTRYRVTICNKDKNEKPWEFEGWISKVDNLKFLTLCSLSSDSRYNGNYLFFHYELMPREKTAFNGLGPRRIRIIEPQLDESMRMLDSYYLRQAIRENLRKGTLLLPQGSTVWTRTGRVSLRSLQ
ncbi:MAG: hypothetical protein ACH346_06760 [Chthoniobacterales bacterium]